MSRQRIVGISSGYHDSAACLIEEGVDGRARIVAAAQEERFTRVKHDAAFPTNALRYALAEAGATTLDAVAYYDKPILKFHRILETSLGTAPRGLRRFAQAVPVWLKDKLWIEPEVITQLKDVGVTNADDLNVAFPEHHRSHAASAFFPSPFESAAVLTIDGVGEWATATLAHGEGSKLEILQEMRFPHSLGLLYSAMTYFCGFRVNSGEYKLMGLAPYGEGRYTQKIFDHLLDLKDDGSFRLDLDYFAFLDRNVMTNERFATLFGGPARAPESPLTTREMDLARSVQEVTEQIVLRMAKHARKVTGEKYLCLAGGVALNCVANGHLLRSGIFDEVFIQPAAGDAGGALGAALSVFHAKALADESPKRPRSGNDDMDGAYLGPEFSPVQIRRWLDAKGYPYTYFEDDADWASELADRLANEEVVGLFQGRMEFGPRALGNRSIVGDPRSAKMQSVMNLKIKQRESFRPFAPAVLEEDASEFFELDGPSPYMLLVAPVCSERRIAEPENARDLPLKERVNHPRSDVPAITHVDHSARVQTVSTKTNPRFHRLLSAFKERSGIGMLINTSFNVRGEPIVCTPEDAYRCFMGTEMDILTLGPFVLEASVQPGYAERSERFGRTFDLD
ncbi:MAG: carbamoyltransferase [Polyangiales bacterium]|jgi:carbamoyltransferase